MAEIKCPCGLRNYMEEEDCTNTNCDACCPLTQTNADRIRAMSDEELANWIDWLFGRCEWCDTNKIGTDGCSDISCTDCIVQWLKQPSED